MSCTSSSSISESSSLPQLVFMMPPVRPLFYDARAIASTKRIRHFAAAGQLGGQHVQLFDHRRFCQQIGRDPAQTFGDFTGQMRLSTCFAGEGVEDAEGVAA